MPGFADVSSDAEIRAVLPYIESTWPERERTYQENVSQAQLAAQFHEVCAVTVEAAGQKWQFGSA